MKVGRVMNLDDTLHQIDDIKAKLDTAPPFNEVELGRIRENFMINFTYNSNAIEGNSLTLRETALVVLEDLTISKKPLKDHFEAIGHQQAFDYIVDLSKSNEDLSERVIKEIHALVLMNVPEHKGKYRESSVIILGADDIPPHPSVVPSEMERLLNEYKSDTRHPVVKIADFHINFERIHPFADGNGRTGSLFLNLDLIKAGYAPINVKFTDRDLYIDCFTDYNKVGNSSKFIEMVAKYELEELTTAYTNAIEKEAVQELRQKGIQVDLEGFKKYMAEKRKNEDNKPASPATSTKHRADTQYKRW